MAALVFPNSVFPISNAAFGTVDLPLATSATRIARGEPGRWHFGDEVPLSLTLAPRRSTGEVAVKNWLRMEFRTQDKSTDGQTLIAVVHPYETKLLGITRFKPPLRAGRDQISPSLEATHDPATMIAELDSEYFETGRSNTASVHGLQVIPGPYENGRIPRATGWFLAICEDYDSAVEETRYSPLLSHLETLTRRRTLQFTSGPVAGSEVKLSPDIVDDCVSILYGLALSQAFGGPGSRAGWVGHSVDELVERIYKLHVNNFNRWHQRIRRRR